MRTALSSLELAAGLDLDAVLRLLRDDPTVVPVAGCTDVYPAANCGKLAARRFVSLWGIPELRRIAAGPDGGLVIGAATTFTEIARSPLVRERLPILAEAASQIGSRQVQNRATLGGNVVNASPAGDSLPVLAVAEATLELWSAGGRRRVPFLRFYTGYRATVLAPGEIVGAVDIPAVEGRQWFRKVGTRSAQSISKVTMAAVRAPRPRLALGSVAPTVIRLPETEALLAAGGTLDEAEPTLALEMSPIDDVRSTAEYRRRVAANLLARFWEETAEPARRRSAGADRRRTAAAGRRARRG